MHVGAHDGAQPRYQTKRPPFGAWLLTQHKRPGLIGQLAKAAKGDPDFPVAGDVDAVGARLSDQGADSDMHVALEDAELDYLAL